MSGMVFLNQRRMLRWPLLCSLLTWTGLPLSASQSLPLQLSYRSSAEFYQPARSLFFPQSSDTRHQVVLDAEVEQHGFRSHLAARKQWLDGEPTTRDELILSELFLDTSWRDWEITVGKKRLNWGVGYAYQPLNIMQTETQMATGVVVDEGAWLISAERFTDSGVWTLLAASGNSQQQGASARPDGAGLRYYQLVQQWDLQALLFIDETHQYSLGGSAVGVVGDATTLHLTTLWNRRYRSWQPQFEPAADWQQPKVAPVQLQQQQDGWQLLMGAFISWEPGFNLLVEYWYDGRSLSAGQWQDVFDQAAQWSQHPEAASLLGAGQALFLRPNLLAHNLMLYFSYEQPDWQGKLDVQYTPEDQGHVMTARLSWPYLTAHSIEVGLRHFAGPVQSVYRQVPHHMEWFLRFEGRF